MELIVHKGQYSMYMYAIFATLLLTIRGDISSHQGQQGPSFIREPPNRLDFHNTTGAVIHCSARGRPAPLITWSHPDGTPVRDIPGLRHIQPDGSLVFPPFRPEQYRQDVHAAVYTCVASNLVGSITSREVHVRSVVHHSYKAQVYDEFVIRGNTAVLRCHVPPFVRDFVSVVSWVRDDGVTISSTTARGGRYSILPSGELYIRSATQADSSAYSCQTRHRLTGDVSVSATAGRLIVTEPKGSVPPRISDSHAFITGREGETVELPCAAQAFPLPTYTWHKEDGPHLSAIQPGRRIMQLDGTLVIQHAVVEDNGKYVCIVNNTVGEEQARTTVTISAPLSVFLHPAHQVVDVGKTATLNCTVTGHPINTINWMKDRRPLVSDSRIILYQHVTLRITSLQRDDKGMYQCFAQNDFESAQASAELRLGDVAPSIIYTFSEETVRPGSFISLKCSASGNPLPQITWSLDGMKIPSLLRFRLGDFVTSEAHVISYVNITGIRVVDGGEYACTASNTVGSVDHKARINVLGLPIIRQMPNVTVVAGHNLELRCPVSGYPIESITWERGGNVLPINHRQKVESSSSKLIVSSVERVADEGEYQCIARNREGQSARGRVHVFIAEAPLIDPHPLPEVVQASEGQKVKMMCSVVQGDPPIRLSWIRDGQLLVADNNVMLQNLEDSSVLVFRRVLAKDSGNYTCVASNDAASDNRTTSLVVNVPPRWDKEPENAFVVLGQRLYVNCLAYGFPNPRISWKKATGKTPTHFKDILSSYHHQVYANGTLAIHEAEDKDAGYYMCQASNGIGAGLSKVIFVTVHTPPKFRTKFTSQSVAKGETVTLQCEAEGDPPLTVTWQKDKQAVDFSLDKRQSVHNKSEANKIISKLTITSSSRQDSALYTCLVTNRFGSDDTNIQLVVQEPPESPVDVRVREHSSRTVVVSWAPSFGGNSPITKYIIQYKNSSASWTDVTSQMTVPGTEVSATIRRLLPVSSYDIRIVAENSLGISEPSDSVTITTEEEVPGGPPLDVMVEATGAQSLKVKWKPPRKELQHGIIRGYYVGYKVSETMDAFQYKNVEATDISGEQFEMSYLTNLQRNTKYSIIVQAYNNVGAGPRSDEVFATTLEAAPPTSPVLEVTFSNSSAIVVKWDRQNDDNSVKDYVIHYKADGGSWQQQRIATSTNYYILDGLQCGTRYRIYMTASNSLGTGEPSDPVIARTKGGAPVSPQKSDFVIANSTFITILLNAWQSGGCPIDHFVVRYRSTFQRQWTLASDRVTPQEETFVVRHLVAGREYRLMVTAHSDAGTTEAEYTVWTLNKTLTVPIASHLPPSVLQDSNVPVYKNLTVLLPVVISFIVLVIVIVTVAVCLRRQADIGSRGSNGDEGHEYAEPYAAIAASRCVVHTDDDSTASLVLRSQNEGPYATIKRSPPRPSSYLLVTAQGGDVRLARQLAAADRLENSSTNSSSSHSANSGGRSSSQSSETYKLFRHVPKLWRKRGAFQED